MIDSLKPGLAGVTLVGLLSSQTALAGHTNIVLEASLDGRQEVSSDASNRRIVGDPNGRGEAYVFGVDGDPFTLCYVLTVEKIALDPVGPVGEGMAAHIHKGAFGDNGPVVAVLAGPEDGNAADCLTEGEPGKFPLGTTVAEILENPGEYYINVHNVKYPAGAIRGQLERQGDSHFDDDSSDDDSSNDKS